MAFSADEVQDGTGKVTAIVYEQPEDAADWLDARGKSALKDAAEADRNSAYLVATEVAEDAVRPHFRGAKVSGFDQRLLYPAVGAYDSTGSLVPQDRWPVGYVEGIRLLADRVVTGKFMPYAGGPAGIVEEQAGVQGGGGSIKYREGVDLASLQANHPEEWKRIRCAIPRL